MSQLRFLNPPSRPWGPASPPTVDNPQPRGTRSWYVDHWRDAQAPGLSGPGGAEQPPAFGLSRGRG